MSFKRLVRFIDSDGAIRYGDAILPPGETDVYAAKEAHIITGDVLGEYTLTGARAVIAKLLSPLDPGQVPNVRCVGMNYTKHALEIGLEIPKWPVLFYKPRGALSGPSDPIVVPPVCQIPPAKIDYEVELTIVIGKEGRDIPAEKAHEYILGYTIANDVSQRTWQIERGGTQFGTGKMFDTFAPFGPAIVPLKDADGLRITTKVNGVTRQDGNTSDMIFDSFRLVAHMSAGTTLKPGDLILTGTPSGVAVGRSPSPWLKDGDEVELSIEKIGKLKNRVIFDRDPELIKRYTRL